jgi:hypothetical protein
METNLPIACLLTDSELQVRRRDVLQKAKSAVTEIKELEDGFAYRFSTDESRLSELASLVELEHQCCPFLRFRITVEPGNGPIWLELTGPDGTKAFLADLFN